jgi:hypothetical protein
MSDEPDDRLEALHVMLQHVQAHIDELRGDGLASLALHLARLSDDTGTLAVHELSQADAELLRGLVDRIAEENGQRWEVGP